MSAFVTTSLPESFNLVLRQRGLKCLIYYLSSVVWEETLTWSRELHLSVCQLKSIALLLTGRHPNPFFLVQFNSRRDVFRKSLKKLATQSSFKTRPDLHLSNMSATLYLNCPLITDHQKSWLPCIFIDTTFCLLSSFTPSFSFFTCWNVISGKETGGWRIVLPVLPSMYVQHPVYKIKLSMFKNPWK